MSEAADPHTPSADAVSEVVFRVRELPTLEHARAIEDLCGCQPEVAEEVRLRLRILELADQALGLTVDPATLPYREGAVLRPSSVPGYEVLEEVGRGGMGVVYRVRQTSLGREVALKMILAAGHTGEAEMARFRREAEALARLQHPNIVQVFDIAEHDGRPFFSLEFCAGGSLEKKLAGTPMLPRDAAALARTLALAIQAAHQAQVIHRDLKPANVLLTADGTVKITDFGLAKKLDQVGQTESGAIMGTPSYMAPEQAEGRKTVSPAADIYALGAILYECLTGRPPFKAATVYDTILQVVAEEPVPPRRLNAKVPRDLETIAMKCLHKEPAGRYASASDLADDLGRFLEGQPIKGRRASAAERVARWAARRPGVVALVAVALVSAVGLAGVLWQWGRAEAMATGEARARRAMRHALYAAEMNLGAQAWRVGDLARVLELARQHLPEPGEEDLRGWEWYHLWQLGHADWRSLGSQGRWVRSLAWSPDGERIATGGYDNTVRVWETKTRRQLHQFDKGHTRPVHRVAFDATGRWLASGGDDGAIWLWDLQQGQGKRVFLHDGQVWGGLAFLPGGRLVTSDLEGAAYLHHLDKGRHEEVPGLESCRSLCCSPSGDLVVFACDEGWVFLWDVSKKRGSWLRVSEQGYGVLAVAIDPGGQHLAVGGRFGMVQLWDLKKREKRFDLAGHALSVWGLDFAPDGFTLASACWDGKVKLWDVRAGREKGTVFGHLDAVKHAAFSPRDGNLLATASKDGTVRLWKLPLRQGPITLRPPGMVTRAWAAAGLLTVQGKNGVSSWRMSDGEPVAAGQPPPAAPAGEVRAVSPDGKAVATAEVRSERDRDWWAVRLKDTETGNPLGFGMLAVNSPIKALAFAPDGRTLAAGDESGFVKLWDPATGLEKLSLPPAGGAVLGLFFAADGRSLAVVSENEARLWFACDDDDLLGYLEQAHEADTDNVHTKIDLARLLAHRVAATKDRAAGRRARQLLAGLSDEECPQRARWLAALP